MGSHHAEQPPPPPEAGGQTGPGSTKDGVPNTSTGLPQTDGPSSTSASLKADQPTTKSGTTDLGLRQNTPNDGRLTQQQPGTPDVGLRQTVPADGNLVPLRLPIHLGNASTALDAKTKTAGDVSDKGPVDPGNTSLARDQPPGFGQPHPRPTAGPGDGRSQSTVSAVSVDGQPLPGGTETDATAPPQSRLEATQLPTTVDQAASAEQARVDLRSAEARPTDAQLAERMADPQSQRGRLDTDARNESGAAQLQQPVDPQSYPSMVTDRSLALDRPPHLSQPSTDRSNVPDTPVTAALVLDGAPVTIQLDGGTPAQQQQVAADMVRVSAELAALERTDAEQVAHVLGEVIDDAIEGAVLGNFSENTSVAALAAQVAVGCTPLGITADARDIAAAITHIHEGRDGAWLELALNVAAIIPTLDALKAGQAETRAATTAVHDAAAGERAAAGQAEDAVAAGTGRGERPHGAGGGDHPPGGGTGDGGPSGGHPTDEHPSGSGSPARAAEAPARATTEGATPFGVAGKIAIEEYETSSRTVIANANISHGPVQIIGNVRWEGRVLHLDQTHIAGPGLTTGVQAVGELRALMREFGRAQGASHVVVHPGARTTGTTIGRVPRAIELACE